MPNEPRRYTQAKLTGIRLLGKKMGDTYLYFKRHPNLIKGVLLAAPLITYNIGYARGRDGNPQDMYIISTANDIADDSYDGVIPAKVGKKDTVLIPDDSIVLVKGTEIVDEDNEVIFTDENGESYTGKVDGKYLNGYYPMTEKQLLEYNNLYEIVPKEGANLRIYPDFSDKNIIAGIEGGAIVFGGVPVATAENEFFWVPILSIGHGINVGYIRSDLVELQNTNIFSFSDKEYENFVMPENSVITEQARQREESKKTMIVDTSGDGEIDLKLREEASIDSEIIDEIRNGSVLYVYEDDLNNRVVKGGHVWVKVHYIIYDSGEVMDDKTGYVDLDYLREKEDNMTKIETQAEEEITYAVKSGTNTYYRMEPSVDSTILLNLMSEYKITVTASDLESAVKDGKYQWVKVNIHGNEGYVKLDDLEEVERTIDTGELAAEDEENEVLTYYYSINGKGRVTGVDADGPNYTGYDAKTLYSEGITNSKVEFHGENEVRDVDVSFFGKVSFNMIKIGSIANTEEFTILDRGYNEDLVHESNASGIAYFPYMYASVTNKQEAEELANYIINMMNSMENCPSIIYIDYEKCSRTKGIFTHPDYDEEKTYEERLDMLNEIIESNTEAVAHLCNILAMNDKIPRIYTSRQATLDLQENGEQLLDLDKLNELTGIKDLWITAPDQGGNMGTGSNGTYIRKLENEGKFNVVVTQDILDGIFTVKDEDGMDKGIQLDLDSMTEEDYMEAVIEGAPKTMNGKPVKVEFVKVPNKELARKEFNSAEVDMELE